MTAASDPERTVPTLDRVRDLALIDEVDAHLGAVQAALGRLDDGTYGRCPHCGAPIADDRLAADPLAPDCGGHPPAAGAG